MKGCGEKVEERRLRRRLRRDDESVSVEGE